MSNGSTIRLSGDPFPEHLVERGPRRTYLERDSTYLATSAPSLDVDSWTDHLPDFLKKAYNESITGLAHTVMKGEKPFDLSRYDPNILEDIAAQIFSFVMPLDFATLGVGAKIGTTLAKPVVKKLIAGKVAPRVAERAATLGAAKAKIQAINRGVTDATMLGFYDGLHSGIEQQAEEGGVDLTEVLKSTAAGAFLGASMGGVGGYLKGKGVKAVPKTAAEIATLGVAIPVSEARVPNPNDVVGAAGMVLGLKAAGKGLGMTKRTYDAIKYIGDKKIEAGGLTPEVIAKEARKEVRKKRKKVLAQRTEPEKILAARKKAQERGDKLPRLAEIWYSKLGRTPKGGRREVIIGKVFKDPETKKNMIPLYDVASGRALKPMLENRFYDTHVRFKAGVREASGVISFTNFAKKSASHKSLAQDLETLTRGKEPTIFAEQAQIIMETLKGVDEKTIKGLRVELSRQLKKPRAKYTLKGGRTKEKGPRIRIRAKLAEKLRGEGIKQGKSFDKNANVMNTFLEAFGAHTWFKGLTKVQSNAVRTIFKTMKAEKVDYVISSKGGKDVVTRISALEKYFREGGATAKEAKALSTNPANFFSRAFAEYALTERLPTRELAPFYKNMMGGLAENLAKVRSRNKAWGSQQQLLETVFDSILGKKAPTRIKKVNLKKYRISAIKRMEKTLRKYGMQQADIAKIKSTALGTSKQVRLERLSNKSLEKIIERLRFERDVANTQKRMAAIKANIAEIPKEGFFSNPLSDALKPVEKTLNRTRTGKDVTSSVDNYLSTEKNIEGTIYERLREAGIHLPFMTFRPGAQRRHAEKIADAMEDPRTQTEFNKIMNGLYDEFVKPLADKGVEVQKRIGNYFPRIMREDVANIIFDDTYKIAKLSKIEHLAFDQKAAKKALSAGDFKKLSAIIEKLSKQKKGKLHRYTKDAIQHLIDTQGNGISTTFQAVHRLREMSFRDKFISFGNIEKSRKAELPSGFYERRADVVLHRYATKLARRVAYVENFGPKGEKMLGRIKKLEIKDPKAARMATEMFDQLTGIVELNPDKGYSPLTKKFLDEWMSFSVGTKIGLGLATIPNITQSLISTIADAGYMNFFRSAIKGATESRRKFVRTSGAINYNVNKQMFGQRHDSYLSKVADKITFFSGFQTINKINNWLAASTAADWIPKLIKEANAKTTRTFKVGGKTFSKRDWAREKLKDLNIDYKKKMTEETITKGMVKFARDSQLQKSVLKDPQFFNSPAGRPLVTFKRFGLRQFYYSKDLMWKDYKRGNVLPTIRMAMGGMAGGVGVIWAKNEIRELLSGEPHYRDDVGAKAVIANIAAVGAFGVATDIVASESIVRSLGFLVTPVQLSDTAKIYSAVLAFEKDLQEGYGLGEASHRSVMRVAGVFGTLTKEAAKRIQPEEQKKNRILQLKGVRRNEILDLFIESQDLAGKGKREKAIKVREEGEKKWELWNKAYRNMGYYTDKERRWKSFGLTTEELSYKEILRKVAERREKRVGKKYA